MKKKKKKISIVVMNVDVNIQFDHNAKYRQAKIFSMADQCETDPREIEARRVGLSWIGLPGNIGCLGNSIVDRSFDQ